MVTAKRTFNEALDRFTRQLHLYGGLFVCSFLLIFAISTIRLNHGWNRPPDETMITVALPIPADVLVDVTNPQVTADMTPEEQAAARQALATAGSLRKNMEDRILYDRAPLWG